MPDIRLGQLVDAGRPGAGLLDGQTRGLAPHLEVAKGQRQPIEREAAVLVDGIEPAAPQHRRVAVCHVNLFAEGGEALADVGGGDGREATARCRSRRTPPSWNRCSRVSSRPRRWPGPAGASTST